MKVLSIKEPWASLIMNGTKKIETRSWKTKYRGEIYIHASLSKAKITKPEVYELIKDMNFKCGYIICKCNLVDCIYMTDEYVNDMKTNHYEEYICGHYEVGRYAWIVEDVKVIEPIEAKGKLGLWNY
ncbi:MAG: ASCH domain-containing protein [Bacilli bacterium]|nr:ASCH domain-containing protein [Bacilli bacterium]